MMLNSGDHMGGWDWVLMGAGSLVVWLVVIVTIAWLLHGQGVVRYDSRTSRLTPEDVLAERFARGEIDEREYRQRLEVLGDGPSRRG